MKTIRMGCSVFPIPRLDTWPSPKQSLFDKTAWEPFMVWLRLLSDPTIHGWAKLAKNVQHKFHVGDGSFDWPQNPAYIFVPLECFDGTYEYIGFIVEKGDIEET